VSKIADAISDLVFQGLALCPVRPSEGSKKGTPLVKWSECTRPFTELEIFDLFGRYGTETVAMICGEISGRLVCLDVDSKHKPGIDGFILSDLEKFFPEIYSRLRIERTPSGGIHLLYRIVKGEMMPGYVALASVPVSDSENAQREAAGEKKIKSKGFLELKGQGCLSHCFPSPGYSVIKDVAIDNLSWQEHSALLDLFRSYNEYHAPVKAIKAEKTIEEFYSVNPYEDFDGSADGELLLEEAGWVLYSKDGLRVRYGKPGSIKECHAAFTFETRHYKIWTDQAGIEPKSYSPSHLKCELEGWDKKKLYNWLVAKGYGKIRKEKEVWLVDNAVKAGRPIPANVSAEGQARYAEENGKRQEQYPFGIFWETSEKGVIHINREKFLEVSDNLQFKEYLGEIVRIDGFLIKKITEKQFYDQMKKYISEDEGYDLFDAYEGFLQKSGQVSIRRLRDLDTNKLLKSSENISYKFFKNCFVKITKDSVEEIDYGMIDGLIFEEQIRQRDFKRVEDGLDKSIYWDFINKAIVGGVSPYLMKCIGYYAHDFRDENGYFIIGIEEVEESRRGGGAGKNVFFNLFKEFTTYLTTPGITAKMDDMLLNVWRGQKVYCFADIPKNFNIEFLKEQITGGGTLKRLFKDQIDLSVEDMPKFCASSNFSFDDTHAGLGRRIRQIEFTDYFIVRGDGAIRKEYGKMFPKDWDNDDFDLFDNIIIQFIQEFLKADRIIDKFGMTESGWRKQYTQKYSHLLEFFEDKIENWCNMGHVETSKFNDDYNSFQLNHGIQKRFACSPQKVNDALYDYCEKNKIEFNSRLTYRENGILKKGRSFNKLNNVPDVKPESEQSTEQGWDDPF
jgi:hypothetical protein